MRSNITYLKKAACSLGVLSLILLITFSCARRSIVKPWMPPSGMYAFIEFYETRDGTASEGEAPPGMRIHGPTYSFSQESGQLISFMDNDINIESLGILIGKGLVLRGTEGGGMHSKLTHIDKLPYNFANLSITRVTANELEAIWEGKEIKLGIGDQFLNVKSATDTVDAINGKAIVERTITHSVKFYGLLKKEDLTIN